VILAVVEVLIGEVFVAEILVHVGVHTVHRKAGAWRCLGLQLPVRDELCVGPRRVAGAPTHRVRKLVRPGGASLWVFGWAVYRGGSTAILLDLLPKTEDR